MGREIIKKIILSKKVYFGFNDIVFSFLIILVSAQMKKCEHAH